MIVYLLSLLTVFFFISVTLSLILLELVFNAEYFLKSESSSLSQYSSSIEEEEEAVESEEMEVIETNPFALLRQQQLQKQQFHQQQQQYYHQQQQQQQLFHQHRQHQQQRQLEQEQMYREQQLYARGQNFRDFEQSYREPIVPTPVMTRVESPPAPVRNHSEFIKKAANNHMSMLTHIGATNVFKTSNSYASTAQLAGYESITFFLSFIFLFSFFRSFFLSLSCLFLNFY